MEVLAQRVGGNGHASRNLYLDFEDGHIPFRLGDEELRQATLNLVLEAGCVFRTPANGSASKEYVSRNGETYYLQEIRLSVIDGVSRRPLHLEPPFQALIHRNRPHPTEFDNVIEVVAPDLSEFLSEGVKQWFRLEGPFERV